MENLIKTFEDACAKLGIDPNLLPDVSNISDITYKTTNYGETIVSSKKAVVAQYKLGIIALALNDGWIPNWNNWNEYKYYPYFEIEASEENPSGSGFSGSHYDVWRTCTTVGSRLCFKTRDIALYAGKQFADLYKDLFLLTNNR